MLDESPAGFSTDVRWSGEIDIACAEQFKMAITEAAASVDDLVVDLRDTTFIDSTGIGVLVTASNDIAERGGSMTVRVENPSVRRVFWMMNLDVSMDFEPPLTDDEHHARRRISP